MVTALLAGCLGGDSDGPDAPGSPPPESSADPDWARRAVYGPDFDSYGPGDPVAHDHSDRSLHAATTPNFEVLGFDPLVTQQHGMSAGGYYCGELSTEGGRVLAVVNSFTSQVAMVVVDVTDPTAPEMLGELVLKNAQIYDSAITADGRFAYLATSPLVIVHEDAETPGLEAVAAPETITVQPVFTDRCGNEYQGPEDELPVASGIALIDIRDPTAPSVADFVSQPAIGPHSVSSANIDGTQYAIASNTNLVYTASFFSVFTVDELPGGIAKLTPFVEYSANYDQQVDPSQTIPLLLNGHVDASLAKHTSGDLYMWVANWDGGLHAVRIDGPGQATKVAEFGARDPARGDMAGAIHSAYVVGDRNGSYYVVTGQEVGSSLSFGDERRPTGQIVILDATDPTALTPVARWTLPVDVAWSGDLHMSTHYMAMVGDTLFVANYHNGVWAADASAEQWPDLPSLGVFMPSLEASEGIRTDRAYAPYVLDVLAQADGSLLVFDGSGAYTVAFTGQHRDVPPPEPWSQEYIG